VTPEHQQLREALGAYVVGALDPAERRAVEEHLAECDDCTAEVASLSALPGLLGRVSEQEARADLLVPPDDLLDGAIRLLTQEDNALRTRLRRWRVTAVAACLIAVAAVVVASAPWETGPDRVVAAAEPAGAGPTSASGEVAAIAWEWGTTVELQAEDLPRRDGYVLWAVAEDGRRERTGTWGVTSSGSARVRGASSIARDELARVEVTDRDGNLIMSFSFDPRTQA
jgi:anti-sigma factor RsiW